MNEYTLQTDVGHIALTLALNMNFKHKKVTFVFFFFFEIILIHEEMLSPVYSHMIQKDLI